MKIFVKLLICVLGIASASVQISAQGIKKITHSQYGTVTYYLYLNEEKPPVIINVVENHFLIYQDADRRVMKVNLLHHQGNKTQTVGIAEIKYDGDNFYYINSEKRQGYYVMNNGFNGLIMTPEMNIIRNIRLTVSPKDRLGRKVYLETGNDTIATYLW